jgi:hypothetical protein
MASLPGKASEVAAALGHKAGVVVDRLREKHFDKWLPSYLRDAARRVTERPFEGHRHLLFAFCDHFEPRWKGPPPEQAQERVRRWTEGYPRMAASFRDAEGRGPRHSFFFPGEEYAPEYLAGLADLARAGHGEVELHLHHDNDTADNLRREITRYLGLFAEHGHLSRDGGRETGDGRQRLRYAFIHGNWCLANARSDGRWCGVDAEMPLLHETGCYADFTFPAVPDESQPGILNQIYWPQGDLARRRAYEQGRRARVGERFDDRLLMIEGPLAVVLGKTAKRPIQIESGDITGKTPGDADRVKTWVQQNIHVDGRPEWVFVKVHTHGTQEHHADALLGEGARQLHQGLARYNDGQRWSLHYVTAREMYNIALAAMDGKTGDPAEYRDYRLGPPPVARS